MAIRRTWAYAAPFILFLSSFSTLFYPRAIIFGSIGALILTWVFVGLISKYGYRPQWVVMGVAAILLAIGLFRKALHYWLYFLILTVAAERLELSILIPKRGTLYTFYIPVILSIFGAIFGNEWIVGLSYISLAAWLFYYDVAVRNIRARGLTRFVALTLLLGYAWLFIGGLAWFFDLPYDVRIHSITLGFIFDMIFAHAPLIFPAILGIKSFKYSSLLYVPTLLLHLSLLVRFLYDLKIGAALGVIAILLYFITMGSTQLRSVLQR